MVAIAKRPALLESGVKRKRGGSRRPKATQSVIVEDKLKPRKPPGGRTRSSGYHLNAAEKLERQRAIEKGLPPPPRRLSRRKGTTAEGNTAAPAVRGGVSGVAAAPELNDEAASGAKDQAMAVPRRRMNSKGRPSPEEGEAMTNKIPKSRSGSRKATPDKIPKSRSRSGARKAPMPPEHLREELEGEGSGNGAEGESAPARSGAPASARSTAQAVPDKIPKSRSGARKATPEKIPKSRSGARKPRGSQAVPDKIPKSRSGVRRSGARKASRPSGSQGLQTRESQASSFLGVQATPKATPDKIPKSRSGARKARGSREGEAPSSRSGSRTRASGKKAPLKVNLVDSVSAEPDENPLAAPLVEPAEPWGAGLESRAVQPRVLRSRANPGLNLPSAQPVFLDLEAF
uniref:Uncharacterized protein n=1 Tax=Alexandrium monilatum TaxID=311494 RepID=A0A7S4ULV5_9DINO